MKNLMKKMKIYIKENQKGITRKEEKGITLVALVVTIVVLLILAGVSINMVLGENGLISKAKEAKVKMKIYEEKEGIEFAFTTAKIESNTYDEIGQNDLQKSIDNQFGVGKAFVTEKDNGTFIVSFIDSKREYNITSNGIENGIDWEEAMKNAIAPESQDEERNNGVIGIGTDGKPVDMDLWEYTKLEDGTYGLNDASALAESGTRTAGYDINYLNDGKIQGTIPQYIKGTEDKEFVPVTNINYLFYNTDLSEAPTIPNTVTSMRATFNSCINLKEMPAIPGSVSNMFGTFANCPNLTKITTIPNSVVSMFGTFNGCISLTTAPTIPCNVTDMGLTFQNCILIENAPVIPNSVINMNGTFRECTSLKTPPVIPNGVTNMYATFSGCTTLKTAPTIPNSVTDMYGTFSGCTSLKTAPVIPNSVSVMCATFKNCSNLQGVLEINAIVNGTQLGVEHSNNIDYHNCLNGTTTNDNITLEVTGTCPILDKIVAEANNPNIIIQ